MNYLYSNFNLINQLLVGLMVIDVELDMEDHGLIPITAIGSELELLDVRTDSRIGLVSIIDISTASREFPKMPFISGDAPLTHPSKAIMRGAFILSKKIFFPSTMLTLIFHFY